MQTEKVKITQVSVNKANPRSITTEKFEKLIRSILILPKMLSIRPVVVDDLFTVLGGNMRLRALTAISELSPAKINIQLSKCSGYAQKTEAERAALRDFWKEWVGNPTVEIIRASELSDAEQREFIIKDNVGFGEWDYDMLANEWDAKDLDDWGVDVWQDPEEEKETKEDDYSDEDADNAPTRCARGDIWQLGRHRLMCGDSTDAGNVELLMNGELADLLLTDPPYNVDYEGSDGKKIANDNMDDDSFVEFLTSAFNRATESMKAGASYYIWHADSKGLEFRLALMNAGFTLRQTLIWVKNALVMGRQDYQWQHEPCLYGWKDGAGHYFIDDRSKCTVIHENKPLKNDIHPTMKPVKLMGTLVTNSSKQDALVLDLFGGSGSTLIACEELGRRCNMMEFDTRYCDAIIDRWEKLTGEQAVKLDSNYE